MIVEEAEVEYLILDTFANGTAVVTVYDNNESAKSYKVISLVNGYSIRADSI